MVKINPKFKELLPPLSEAEYAQLEESILEEGVREPVKLWRDYVIDGHNRVSICEKHNRDFAVRDLWFADEDEVMEWIYINQLGRRNLSVNQKTIFIGELYELRKKRVGVPDGYKNAAKFNSVIMTELNSETETATDLVVEYDEDYKPKSTAESVATQFNVSPRTVERAAKIVEAVKDNPDLKSEFLAGRITKKEILESLSPEMREAMKKKEEIKNGVGAKWRDATYKLSLQVSSIQNRGGVKRLTTNWTNEHRQHWINELRKLATKLGEFADEIEETI